MSVMLYVYEVCVQYTMLVGGVVAAAVLVILVLNNASARRRAQPPALPATYTAVPRGVIREEHVPMIGEVISVNYHFTRKCNYSCGFCFHTEISGFNLPLADARRGLALLRAEGCRKINFSGGEPFLIDDGRHIGELCKMCKVDLGYDSVTIVSNGSRITEEWFREYAKFVDILAVSCDSFNDATNRRIGRLDRTSHSTPHADQLRRVAEWCRLHKVLFKINTVVNKFNIDEDFTTHIKMLQPVRWKLFQVLEVKGENAGENAKRHANTFLVTSEQFDSFVEAHRESLSDVNIKPVPETNDNMRASYLILDEKMRFLDCSGGAKIPSESILDVGVPEALKKSGFDVKTFFQRGGAYEWSRSGDGQTPTW